MRVVTGCDTDFLSLTRMSSKKNVGRKRLGRIQIAENGGHAGGDVGQQVKRPFQLQSKQTICRKPRSPLSQTIKDDLSFSNSFVCDLEADPDLMSALDKMEKDFGSGNRCTEASVIKASQTNHSETGHGKQRSSESVDVGSNNKNQHASNTSTLVAQEAGRKRNNSKNSVIHLNTSTDLLEQFNWDSPVGVSTPVESRPIRVLRSTKRSAEPISNKKAVKGNIEKENHFKRNLITAQPKTAEDTPHRPISRVKVKKNKEDHADVPDNLSNFASPKHVSKNTFFESLLLENESMDGLLDQNDKIIGNRPQKGDENETNEHVSEDKRPGDKRQTHQKESKTVHANSTSLSKTNKSKADRFGSNGTAHSNGSSNEHSVQPPVLDKNSEMLQNVETDTTNYERNKASATVIQSDQLALSSWGLPDTVLKQYTQRGITHMFKWQAECLLTGNVLNGGNLVYSAPTSAGKTMVAELLVLKKVMETRKKGIIILPFVSVTREKMFYLQELYQDAGIRVSGFMGHYAPAGGFSSVDVAVCTIEKGNGLINRLLEDNSLDKLGIIVVDELHLLGDPHRGYLLELLLTKISYMAKKRVKTSGEPASDNPIQIVGMSATLPNLDLLATWLNADLYKTDYRPVPLLECMKVGTAVYNSKMEIIRDVDLTYKVKGDTEHMVPLCIETLKDGHSVLIFCPSKDWCEKLSETIARELYNLLKDPEKATTVTNRDPNDKSDVLVLPLNPSALRDVVEQLRRTPVGLDQMLGRTVPYGAAYHHAGLTFDERDIVEGAFRQGILKVLVATSTLSSGVNLPARRVLIRTPVFYGGKVIDFLTYKQMIGRAGRKGVDTAGESILLCKPNEKSKAMELVTGELPPVKSTLIKNEGEELSSSMKRAILEVVVSGVAMETKDVALYAACTLLATSLPKDSGQTQTLIEQCIAFLQENEFVCKQLITNEDGTKTERFIPTQLGAAVLASSLSPDEGLVVFSELQRARQCFVLENELHIIYQVTPIYSSIGDYIDWYQFFCTWETLTPGMRKVAEMIGVKESFLAKSVRGRIYCKTAAQQHALAIHKRFYTALVLHELVQEVSLTDVSRKFNCNKGQLQSLQQSAATFAGMVTVFCARLGWSNLELILSQFQSRLTFGVQRELCDLVRVSTLNGQRARVLYKGGYQTVAALANAHPADVEALLKNSAPFQSSKKQDKETDWEAAERRKSRCIFLTGRKGVTEYEAAVIIIDEAKAMIQDELGGLGIQWNEPGNKANNAETSSPVLQSPVPVQQRSFLNQRSSFHKKKSPWSGQKRKASKHSDGSQSGSKKKSFSPAGNQLNRELTCVVSPQQFTKNKPGDAAPDSKNLKQVDSREKEGFNKADECKLMNVVNNTKYSVSENQTDKRTEEKLSVGRPCEFVNTYNDKGCLRKDPAFSNDTQKGVEKLSIRSQVIHPDKDLDKDPQTECLSNINTNNKDRSTGVAKAKIDIQGVCTTSSATNSTEQCVQGNTMAEQNKSVEIHRLVLNEQSTSGGVSNPVLSDKGVSGTSLCTSDTGRASDINKEKENVPVSKGGHIGSDIGNNTITISHVKQPSAAPSPNGDTDVFDEFLDTFVLDTQTANSIISGICKTSVSKKASALKSSDIKDDEHKSKIDDDLCSEALFSEIVDGASPEVDKALIDGDQVVGPNGDSPESMDDDLQLKLSESYGSEKSGDDLELNVFQNSNEDMFNNSEDLIAASNYERVALSGETSVHDNRLNDSYEDLHIPYQSGQEACFEKWDKEIENKRKVNVNDNETNSCNKQSRKVISSKIGPFSSPESMEEFPAIGDSFSSTFSLTEVDMDIFNNKDTVKEAKEIHPIGPKPKVNTANSANTVDNSPKDSSKDKDQFGDSLTISMIDMVLETSKSSVSTTCDNPINCHTSQGTSTKQICDNYVDVKTTNTGGNKVNVGSINLAQVVEHTDTAKYLSDDNNDNHFLTPKGRAVKRTRQTPNDRHCKVSKMSDSKHSTPEAQKKDIMRTYTSQNVKPAINKKNQTKNTDKNNFINGQHKPLTDDSLVKAVNEGEIKESKCNVYMKLQDKLDNKYNNLSNKSHTRSNNNSLPNVPEQLDRDSKVNKNEDDKVGSPSVHNVSTGSDCVPPTPPGEDQPTTSTTPIRTPLRSLNAMVYSPILKSSSKRQKSELALQKEECKTAHNQIKMKHDEGKETITDTNDDVLAEGEDAKEDKLSPSFIDPNESGLPLTQASFTVIDVCSDKRLFKTFIMEWRTKSRYAVSIACEKRPKQQTTGGGIGGKYRKESSPVRSSTLQGDGIMLEGHDLMIVGVAVSWENRDAYYVAFTHQPPQDDPDDTLAAPPSDEDISIGIRIKAVKSVLQQAVCKGNPVSMLMFDVKAQYRILAEGCGFVPKGQFEDPKVACWMLDPGARERTLHGMVTNLLPTEVNMLQGLGGGIGVGSLGLSPENPGSGRYRATTECVLVRHLGEYFQACLTKEGLNTVFSEVEMPAAVSLCRMELNGFGFSQEESESQKTVMISKLSALEEQAYTLAGHPFSLSSTEDISQVLYFELRLPPSGDPSAVKSLAPRGVGMGRGKSKPQFSTSKDVLEKLKKLHPLPGIILEWRRITNALTKVVFPLQKEKVLCTSLSMYRIYSECQLHSATGRVSLSEPNLQNVPKDFEIIMPDVIGESPTSVSTAAVGRRSRGVSKLQQMIGPKQVTKVTDENSGAKFSISMRHAFVPFKGGVLLAADYSQLELRMIAYLSSDEKLISVLNKEGDVFKLITAQWKNITPDEVTAEQRAQAKQVCYGMIYGIGPRALGEQLEVDENDAAAFIETFKAKYPGMRSYIRKTVETCREKGYVQTMVGRKRYLQSITSTNPHARAQAERQAVNTTVQGSAADLVKKAMIKIDERLEQNYPLSQYTQKHKLPDRHPARQKSPPDGAYLVLQLHDELIYEVNQNHLTEVAKIVKDCMEHAMDLPVKMPVKIKVGQSWGTLADKEF